MWKVNFCPNCGARAGRNDRFCGTCGFNLVSVVPQISPPSYEYQWHYQQWVPCSPAYEQSLEYASREDRNTAPMSAQISKMLEDLFEKRFKYNKT
jgi:predicted amidophosphoribosyltransferase